MISRSNPEGMAWSLGNFLGTSPSQVPRRVPKRELMVAVSTSLSSFAFVVCHVLAVNFVCVFVGFGVWSLVQLPGADLNK